MRRVIIVGAVVAVTMAAAVSGQSEATAARDAHIAAARATAGSDHVSVFNRLCTAVTPQAGPAVRRPRRQPPGPPGSLAVARRTGEGVRQPLLRRPDRVLGVGRDHVGRDHPHRHDLRLLGRGRSRRRAEEARLDPATIKYAIVSHGHGDHSGGAKFLQDHFGTRIILSAADWDLLERSSGTKPKRDMVATDGQKLTLGDTTLTMYLTPGHTLGTISTLIPVKDGGKPHLAAAWGGTAFNWLRNRTRVHHARAAGPVLVRDLQSIRAPLP